jgi:hypothetical protein
MKRRHTIFMLVWDRYRLDEKHARTRYAELVFMLWGEL